MDHVMTLAEMETKFDAEWVLVGEPQTDESHELLGGTVLWHSKDRDEVYRKAIELRPPHFAMHYTGSMPENTAVVL